MPALFLSSFLCFPCVRTTYLEEGVFYNNGCNDAKEKSGGCMEYYVYLDVLFLRIFLYNLLCLISLGLLFCRQGSVRRILLSSAAGTIWNLFIMITGISVKGMGVFAAAVLCFLAYGTGKSTKERMLPVYLCFIAFCVEGTITWAGTQWGSLFVPVICRLIGRQKRRKDHELKVILFFQGRKKEFDGFYDSGNQLSEPLTGKMVHIVCYEDMKDLLSECYQKTIEKYFETGMLNSTKVSELQMYEFTFLSYHSIGKENGQLLGIRMDSAEFVSNAGKKTEDKVVIGLTKQKLFVRGRDRMIVNGRLEL